MWSDPQEDARDALDRANRAGIELIRIVGSAVVDDALRADAAARGIHVADDPVTSDGRIELLHYLREQSVSRTRHRYGNLV